MRPLRLIPLLATVLVIGACSDGAEAPQDVTQSPYFSENDQIIDLEGQAIRYRDTGPRDAQALVLLHGFTDSLHTWDGIADILDEEFRVLRPDLPGHGLSGLNPDGDYRTSTLVSRVSDFIEYTGATDPILVGNSLGGLVAWRLASNSPDDFKGLVLLAPGGVPANGVGEEPIDVPAMLSFYLKNAPAAGVKASVEAMYADPSRIEEGRIEQYRDLMAGQGDAFVGLAGQFTLPDPADALAQVTTPTILIWGDQDVLLPIEQADVFQANLPNVELIRLEGVGHLPQAEAPDVVIDAIRQLAAPDEDRL